MNMNKDETENRNSLGHQPSAGICWLFGMTVGRGEGVGGERTHWEEVSGQEGLSKNKGPFYGQPEGRKGLVGLGEWLWARD